MPRPEINEDRCFGCMNCVTACPMGILNEPSPSDIIFNPSVYKLLVKNPEICTGCKRCVDTCPHDAIRIVETYEAFTLH